MEWDFVKCGIRSDRVPSGKPGIGCTWDRDLIILRVALVPMD